MSQQETLGMTEFFEKFNTEESCREYMYLKRWPNGFVCPKCGVSDEPFQIISRKIYQCKHCNHQTSVTAGTIMDKSRTPLHKWFLAIYLMSEDKRGCSALRLKRELKVAYDTAWTMSHKIRNAMKKRDDDYTLSGYKAGHPEFIKAKVLQTVDSESIVNFARATVEEGSSIASDGLSVYRKLAENGYVHLPENFNCVENPAHLKWLHVVISNLKSFISGTYHGIAKVHLQAFLDEFCYRFNRRFWPSQLFARTLVACSAAPPFTRYELIG